MQLGWNGDVMSCCLQLVVSFMTFPKQLGNLNVGCNWKTNCKLTIFHIVIINSTSCKSIQSSYLPWFFFQIVNFKVLYKIFCVHIKFGGLTLLYMTP
jgi:hypothetical protein